MTWKDGRSYKGDFDKDKRHGNGVFTDIDGLKYDGSWHNNNLHGKCMILDKDENITKTIWEHGI